MWTVSHAETRVQSLISISKVLQAILWKTCLKNYLNSDVPENLSLITSSGDGLGTLFVHYSFPALFILLFRYPHLLEGALWVVMSGKEWDEQLCYNHVFSLWSELCES